VDVIILDLSNLQQFAELLQKVHIGIVLVDENHFRLKVHGQPEFNHHRYPYGPVASLLLGTNLYILGIEKVWLGGILS
jgi:hypothetical protein